MTEKTFFWYDYETTGVDPKTSRVSQFAGIRTDENLNPIKETTFYCKPSHDVLPNPGAINVTSITPQHAYKHGLSELDFVNSIHKELTAPNTTTVGYNSINFDDEYTRYSFYRNFLDPYEWHWKNNNSRWDIINVVRLCYAVRKDSSLKWAYKEDGVPSFKLQDLTEANGIKHTNAHDALSDTHATIALARIIKQTQPKLFDYCLSLKSKKIVGSLVKLFEPMLKVSEFFPAKKSHTRLCLPVAYHPEYPDRAILFNLDQDPSIILETPPQELKKRLYTPSADLDESTPRPQFNELIFNKSPIFKTSITQLPQTVQDNLGIDMNQALENARILTSNAQKVTQIVQEIYRSDTEFPRSTDPEQNLYSGFLSPHDRSLAKQISKNPPANISLLDPQFNDIHLSDLYFHYKARNFPDSLSSQEKQRWAQVLRDRFIDGKDGHLTLEAFDKELEKQRTDSPEKAEIWDNLRSYADWLLEKTKVQESAPKADSTLSSSLNSIANKP